MDLKANRVVVRCIGMGLECTVRIVSRGKAKKDHERINRSLCSELRDAIGADMPVSVEVQSLWDTLAALSTKNGPVTALENSQMPRRVGPEPPVRDQPSQQLPLPESIPWLPQLEQPLAQQSQELSKASFTKFDFPKTDLQSGLPNEASSVFNCSIDYNMFPSLDGVDHNTLMFEQYPSLPAEESTTFFAPRPSFTPGAAQGNELWYDVNFFPNASISVELAATPSYHSDFKPDHHSSYENHKDDLNNPSYTSNSIYPSC